MYSPCVLAVLLYGPETWTLHSLTRGDWTSSTPGVNDGTSDGTITSPTMKSYVAPVCSRPLPSSADEDLDYSVTLPDSLMMSQPTRSFGPVARLKMVSGRLPTGGVLEVDLPPRTWIHQICRDMGIPVTDRRSGAGRRQIVLATNRDGGMLQLNASRHDDDDGDDGLTLHYISATN